MKRKLVFRAVTVILLILFFPIMPVRGAEPDDALGELAENMPDDVISALPDGAAEDILSGGDGKLKPGFFLTLIGDALRNALRGMIIFFSSVAAMLILSSLLSAVGSSAGKDLEKICRFVGGGCVTVTVLNGLIPIKTLASDTLFGMGLVVKSSLPVMTFLCASAGEVSRAAADSMWLGAFLTVTEELAEVVLSPLASILFGFAAATEFSSFSGSPDLSGVSGGVKRTFIFLLSLSAASLTTVMAFQNAVAKRSDAVVLRTVRFASANLIPVVGGALGEAAGNYLAGLSLIKSSAGTFVTVCIIVYLIPAFAKLLSYRFVLSVLSAAAGIFGCAPEAAFLRECGEALGFLLALVAICGAVFIISIAIII